MGIAVDIILIAIIILSVYLGYKKGLIKVAFKVFALLLAIIISLILFKPVSDFIINNTEFDDKIREIIISSSKQEQEDKQENKQENELKDEQRNKQEDEPRIKQDDEPNNEQKNNNIIKKYIEDNVKKAEGELKAKAIETIANTVSIKITQVATAVGLFIIIRIILILLSFLSETIAKFPIIKQFNEFGGLLYGLLRALVIIYLILTIIFIFSSFKMAPIILDAIEESYITKFLYENNLMLKYCLLGKNLL